MNNQSINLLHTYGFWLGYLRVFTPVNPTDSILAVEQEFSKGLGEERLTSSGRTTYV